ncbi:hypothetical protein RJ640_022280 [Escallonia rubra]|uniref:C3H1-type domain-containing protein n=1 Tax=Escallonia rubra TaxID=112253 RepID=A0AA88RFA4_9ASTE|nr:hypothetical protein RJ640_022280 [Escallonia rubra]
MEFGRKRGRQDGVWNGGAKRSREETESFTTGVGSKSKPCMKFFSTSGCQFGEGCHFLHYVPGGYSAVSQMTNLGGPAARKPIQPFTDGPAPSVKTKLCNKYNTAEGCKFGDKCRFAHSEMELGKSAFSGYEDPRASGPMNYGFAGRVDPSPPAAANFGASATAKISIDASLAGAIIGKGGVNSKQICRVTGVKLAIRDHDSDPNQRNIELEGTFDQIKQASAMVGELIMNLGAAAGPAKHSAPVPAHGPPASNFKTKMCENFAKGLCTFGERCHFAHGVNELRRPVA